MLLCLILNFFNSFFKNFEASSFPSLPINEVFIPSFFIVKLATAADPPSLFSIPWASTLIGFLGKLLILTI